MGTIDPACGSVPTQAPLSPRTTFTDDTRPDYAAQRYLIKEDPADEDVIQEVLEEMENGIDVNALSEDGWEERVLILDPARENLYVLPSRPLLLWGFPGMALNSTGVTSQFTDGHREVL